jgi:uncharacterized Zn finger protein
LLKKYYILAGSLSNEVNQMALTLKNFKQAIPSTILSRGRNYYNNGAVTDLSLEEEDTWAAEVQGTEAYDVRITLEQSGELSCVCTCPYEYGEHCKHIAAVLYAIEEAYPEYFEGQRRKPARKRVTRLDKLKAALKATSHEELIAVLVELAKSDRELLTHLLLRLDAAGDTTADYRQLMKDALRPPRGSRGFLDYWASTEAGVRVGELAERAEKAVPDRPEQAVTIFQVILEETIKALDYADDSNGMLSSNIERAMTGLAECAERLAEPERAALFRYCLKEATGQRVAGWDAQWDLLGLAGDLIDSPTQRVELFSVLDSVAKPREIDPVLGFYSQFTEENAVAIKAEVISRLDGDEAAIEYIAENKHLDRFRMGLIQYHLERGDLDTALELAEEGLAALVKNSDWPRWRVGLNYRALILAIARQRGDNKAIVEQAQALWLSRGDQEYYTIMKEAMSADEWPGFRDRLLASNQCSDSLTAWAYAQEGMWARVRDLVFSQPSLLPQYQLELEARFPEETATAYERFVEKMLRETSNRQTYQAAASFLIRMQRLGQGDKGKAIARSLIEQHPQRRAMVEELRRVL